MAFIKNNDGNILIDDKYINYTLVSKQIMPTTTFTNPNGTNYWGGIVQYRGKCPIVAIELDDDIRRSALVSMRMINGITTWYFTCLDTGRVPIIYIFDLVSEQEASGMLVMRNKKGEVTFDSGRKYLKVLSGPHDYRNNPNKPREKTAVLTIQTGYIPYEIRSTQNIEDEFIILVNLSAAATIEQGKVVVKLIGGFRGNAIINSEAPGNLVDEYGRGANLSYMLIDVSGF